MVRRFVDGGVRFSVYGDGGDFANDKPMVYRRNVYIFARLSALGCFDGMLLVNLIIVAGMVDVFSGGGIVVDGEVIGVVVEVIDDVVIGALEKRKGKLVTFVIIVADKLGVYGVCSLLVKRVKGGVGYLNFATASGGDGNGKRLEIN